VGPSIAIIEEEKLVAMVITILGW